MGKYQTAPYGKNNKQHFIDNFENRRVLLINVDIGSGTSGPEGFRNTIVRRTQNPANGWSDETYLERTNDEFEPIYSHPTLGDYVNYKAFLPEEIIEQVTNYKWTAEPSEGYNLSTIQGPNGADAKEWEIGQGDLDWKSGKYEITLEVEFGTGATAKVQRTQTVWQTTDDVIVVGWINGDIVDLPSAGENVNLEYQASAQPTDPVRLGQRLSPLLRADFLANLTIFERYKSPVVPDIGRQYLNSWLIKTTANDEPPSNFESKLSDGSSFVNESAVDAFMGSNTNYRAFTRIKAAYLLDESGNINEQPQIITAFRHISKLGDTPDIPFVPDATFGDLSPEIGPKNGIINSSGASHIFNEHTHSSGLPNNFAQYTEGRLGLEGQDGNRIINRREAPWIWAIIQFSVSGNYEYDLLEHEMFPTYWVYVNGKKVQVDPQVAVETFIPHGPVSN
jgi:hypothetical protein